MHRGQHKKSKEIEGIHGKSLLCDSEHQIHEAREARKRPDRHPPLQVSDQVLEDAGQLQAEHPEADQLGRNQEELGLQELGGVVREGRKSLSHVLHRAFKNAVIGRHQAYQQDVPRAVHRGTPEPGLLRQLRTVLEGIHDEEPHRGEEGNQVRDSAGAQRAEAFEEDLPDGQRSSSSGFEAEVEDFRHRAGRVRERRRVE